MVFSAKRSGEEWLSLKEKTVWWKQKEKKLKKLILAVTSLWRHQPPILDRAKIVINRAKFHFPAPSSFGAP